MVESYMEYAKRQQRIGWLKGIIKSYDEDEQMFGLTPSDESKRSDWKKELAALSDSNDGSGS